MSDFNIRMEHTKLMHIFTEIQVFLNTKYARKERATLAELAKALKVKESDIMFYLNNWVKHLPQGAPSSAVINHLAIFYTAEDNRKPICFNSLPLTNEQRHDIHYTSRGLELPGWAHIKLLHGMILHQPDGAQKVGSKMHETADIIFQSLRTSGMIDEAIPNTFVLPERYLMPEGNFVQQQPIVDYGQVRCLVTWGRRTFRKVDQILRKPHHHSELICLAKPDESPEDRDLRKSALETLKAFIIVAETEGLILVEVRNALIASGASKNARYPELVFFNPSEEFVEVSTTFKQYPDVGKFIMN